MNVAIHLPCHKHSNFTFKYSSIFVRSDKNSPVFFKVTQKIFAGISIFKNLELSKTILRQEAYFVYLMFFIFQYFVRYFNVFKQRLFSSLMMLERLVLELDVMLIGVTFSINTIISFLKQNGNGSRPEMYLEPTRM